MYAQAWVGSVSERVRANHSDWCNNYMHIAHAVVPTDTKRINNLIPMLKLYVTIEIQIQNHLLN